MVDAARDWFTWSPGNVTATNTTSGTTGFTTTATWYDRLHGPTYRVSQATLVVRETADHKPQKFANIAGVQFKRTTRRGKRHYYRAVK